MGVLDYDIMDKRNHTNNDRMDERDERSRAFFNHCDRWGTDRSFTSLNTRPDSLDSGSTMDFSGNTDEQRLDERGNSKSLIYG